MRIERILLEGRVMLTQSQATAINATVKETKQFARERLSGFYKPFTLKWSKRLTSSAGNASRRVPFVIKLSVPIFDQAVEDLGIERTCEEVRNTLLHEIAHIVSNDGHGYNWQCAMQHLGLDPKEHRYHKLTAGLALNQAALKWCIGQEVDFEHNGVLESGRIIRLNQKRASVQVYGYQRHWLVPYRLLIKV